MPGTGTNQGGAKVQPEHMKLYYGRLFPHQTMYKWLAYGNDYARSKHPKADRSFFSRREFCFTLDGDIFVRYQSFKDAEEMEAAIKQKCPAKIDIGPVYNVDPRKRAAYSGGSGGDLSGAGGLRAFQPVERELVFDIDMDDYDDFLNYTHKDHGWEKCWALMAVAIRVLDRGLREDFGFEHIFFVFSGRRGIHCWVCDKRARMMTDEQRAAVANYFSLCRGREGGKAKVMLTSPRHPSVQRAAEILEPIFVDEMLPAQGLLDTSESWEKILEYIPDGDVCDKLRERWQNGRRSSTSAVEDVNKSRWLELCKEVDRCVGRTKDPMKRRQLAKCKDEIVFAYTYPKLDIEVSKKRNHLLKAPFCVHPKTGRVCVPIDPERAEDFDPDRDAPTIFQLLEELDSGAERTSMSENVELFEDLFLKGLSRSTQEELAAKTREAVGMAVDF
ncbi:small subunit of DNA primase [Chloropicon roscoffensis]|uniref:DNA primase n=2 Tax=Chloropicon roscoffensis TaxID=1461544 RepID=A0AAX4P0F6_9CHLO